MDTEELIRRWQQRRREILKTLPPPLVAEYRRLGALIRAVLDEQVGTSAEVFLRRSRKWRETSRRALSIQKDELMDFLKERGQATRKEIIKELGTAPGSLSELLRGKEFEQVTRGVWRLRESRKE